MFACENFPILPVIKLKYQISSIHPSWSPWLHTLIQKPPAALQRVAKSNSSGSYKSLLWSSSVLKPAHSSNCQLIGNRVSDYNFCILVLLYRSTSPNMDDENEEKQLSYGWLQIRPRWLQFLNRPKWFLFFLSQYFFTQSIVVNGIFPGSISTIEKRFGFTRLVNKVSSFTIYPWIGKY